MTVYNILNLFNELGNVRVRLFDCSSEDIIYDSHYSEDRWNVVSELEDKELSECEVGSIDLYRDNGEMFLELNIDLGDEQDEDE